MVAEPPDWLTAIQRDQPFAPGRRTRVDGQVRALAEGRSRAVWFSSLARLLGNVLDLVLDQCPHGGSELNAES